MAIQKIIRVRNIGRLTALNAAGDVAFRTVTLIYGDNGTGKTTLTAIARSMASGDPAPIAERATLGSGEQPEATILTSAGEARFVTGAWTGSIPAMDVFDDTFVRENVYAGDTVDKEQRRNLYQVVVGPAAVALARRIDELDGESRSAARSISSIEADLQQRIQAPFALEQFLELQPDPSATDRIAGVTRELSATRNAAAIVARPQLELVVLPPSPRAHLQVLQETHESFSEDTVSKVRRHIASHLDERGEAWLRQGLGYVRDDICPFCTQDIHGVDLVDLYRRFFSEAYQNHSVRIQRALNDVERSFSSDRLATLDRLALENTGRIQLWADLVDLNEALPDISRLQSVWLKLQTTLAEALRRKAANPGAPVPNLDEIEASLQDFESTLSAVTVLNEAIERANTTIAQVKRTAARGDEAALEQELRRLRNSQIRQEPEAGVLCTRLVAERTRKKQIEEEKAATRELLVSQAQSLLASYETDINRLLRAFGASFSLRGTTPSFAGGKASSTYKLSVNNVLLNVGDSSTPPGTPCFRSVLSAGDKSALALAFFLARLERNPDIGTTVVVLDDPLTSLDAFRTSYTQQYIARLAGRAKQVVVLSHDPFFLKGVADLSEPSTKALRLVRTAGTYTLRDWDISRHCLSVAHKDYFVLKRFLDDGLPDGGELVTVARAIRPYVEGYLKNRFPDVISERGMLGEVITAIRAAASGDDLASLQNRVEELEDINNFSRRVHHSDEGGPPLTLHDDEVRAYIERALAFVRSG
jgi:wobble nucleotide-excising tRNase